MRKHQKDQCYETLLLLQEAHAETGRLLTTAGEKADQLQEAASLLEQCQQGAISLGTMIDELEGDGSRSVSLLEEYCEQVYQLHEAILRQEFLNPAAVERTLGVHIKEVYESIRDDLPTRYEAVFFPYKAAMWDSLESIYLAAAADPDCDAYVVPIPYYDKNSDGSIKAEHYEGGLFPSEIPITPYRNYDQETRHPEMIFIHNPYDEFNHVTTVHPAYYSKKLRDCTDDLVYVPYYATAGYMAEGQALMPSYLYADHIIVQSESMIGFFDSQVPKEKFLPLGSPKFDRIIRVCADPPAPPAEWADQINGKRVFFYNTSLAGFLADTNRFLDKMAYVFDTFRDREDTCLIWRPHPLLESTIDSLRPEVRPAYEVIKQRFIAEKIGILDETPDIESTIAMCDAYLGDSGTSVIALFGVVGKPMYMLNNHLLEAPEKDDWKVWVAQPLRADGNNRYCITMGNRLFEDRDGDLHYRFLCDLSEEYAGGGYYCRAMEAAGKIVVFPANAEHILLLDPGDLSRRRMELKHEVDRDAAFAGFMNYQFEDPEEYWLLPNRYLRMVHFNARTEEVTYLADEAFSEDYAVYVNERQERILAARWFLGTKRLIYTDGEPEVAELPENAFRIPGISIKGRRMLCLNAEGTRLRVISLETGETEEKALAWNGLYVAVLIESWDVMWFLPYEGTVLGRWTLSEDKWEAVDVRIEDLKAIRRPQRTVCDERYFSNAIFVSGKMILAPNWGNKFVEVDTRTYEAREWMPPFAYTTEDKNDHWINNTIGYFYRDPLNREIYFYYDPEHKTYAIDPDAGTCREMPVTFDKDEILGMAPGFHQDSQWMPYCCYEDAFNSLNDIAAGDIHGPAFDREQQIAAYRTVNASPDGDCGEKVYQAILSELKS